ncbi:hypothetical protein EV122DRAFT_205321 [Schizophyllum commune]
MSRTRLYLKNLPTDLTEAEVRKYLDGFGPIVSLKIGHDRSYAFVQYLQEEDAQGLCRTAKHHRLMGADVAVEYAVSRPRERSPVLVDNVPKELCWQQLKDFGRLAGGLVAFCDIDRLNRTRGFLEYWSMAEALDAISKLDGQELGGQPVQLSANFDIPPPKKRRTRTSRSSHERSHLSSRSSKRGSPYPALHHEEIYHLGVDVHHRQARSRRASRRSMSPRSRRRDSTCTLESEYGHELSGLQQHPTSSYPIPAHGRVRHSTSYYSLRHYSVSPPSSALPGGYSAIGTRPLGRDHASALAYDRPGFEDLVADPYDDRAYLYRGFHGGRPTSDEGRGYVDPYAYEHRLAPSWEDYHHPHARIN